ncbi:nucleoside 2-deoxyribosyltransferase [Bacillus sp. A301a_S52]|nr:nucleoside 2-deoxyribosyltransferase [Bacillus sp. A301a_S52]
MGKKVFLAAPFKSLVDKNTSELEKNMKKRLVELISFLENSGYEVHNAHKRELWGKEFMTPEQCTKIDYEEIASCDIFIAFPGLPASPGTHVEIGWASAFNKKMILLLLEDLENYAYLVRGLHTVSDVDYIVYSEEDSYMPRLDTLLKEIENNEVQSL